MRRDPVTPAVRAAVMVRDHECILSKLYTGHECRDVWGYPHRSDDLARLTLEHVKSEPAMGKRAPSDPEHLVLLCGYANVRVPSKTQREAMRQYLAGVTA